MPRQSSKGKVREQPREEIPGWLRYPPKLNLCKELLDSNIDRGLAAKAAIRFESKSISYFDLSRAVCTISKTLLSRGVERSDRVLIRAGNTPEFIASLLAVQRIGAVAVPTHVLYSRDELSFIIKDSDARMGLTTRPFLEQCESSGLESVELHVENTGEVTSSNTELTLCTQGHESAAHGDIPDPVMLRPSTTGLILYTSGTTGKPKGCVHSHRNYLVVSDIYGSRCLGATEADVFASTSSLSFAYGHVGLFAMPLRVGATTCLMDSKFDPAELLATVKRERVTAFFGVPTVYKRILAAIAPAAIGASFASVRCCVTAGEPCGEQLSNLWSQTAGVRMAEHLGSTEMLDGFIGIRMDEVDQTPAGCLGRPLPGYSVKLLDSSHDEEKMLEIGEALVRGPIAMRYNRRGRRDETNWKGWNRTGDILGKDKEGRYWYVSRADDIIKSGGYRISPHEVENVLLKHPKVAEAAVIGLPDPSRGRVVTAYVIPKGPESEVGSGSPQDEMQEEIRVFALDHLARFKVPRVIKVVNELPRTVTGKVSRKKLRIREGD